MIDNALKIATSLRPTRISAGLAKALGKPGFRHAYMARQLKLFLADQIKALRGGLTQSQFGEIIGKPQSVVSRIEKQADRNISIQTLIDIAEKLDIAIIIRFIDFPTFLRYTEDYSDEAIAPAAFNRESVDSLVVVASPRAEGEAEALETLHDLIRRQSDAQQSSQLGLPVSLPITLQQPNPFPETVPAISSAQIVRLPQLQQRVDERSIRNVEQPQRLAS